MSNLGSYSLLLSGATLFLIMLYIDSTNFGADGLDKNKINYDDKKK